MKISKDQVKQLYENNLACKVQLVDADLKSWFPEAFKPKMEVGKWYKNLDKGYEKSICCVVEVNKEDKDCFSGYGIDYLGEYFHEPNDTAFCGSNNWQEATTQEVEAALICEAKKRGYKNGDLVSPLWETPVDTWALYGDKFEYRSGNLHLSSCIFKDGKWAEIIEQKIPLFTTEDGVDIFKGDTFWITAGGNFVQFNAGFIHEKMGSKGCFSTKEKAEEYILFNKPLLSLNEILNAWNGNEYLSNVDDYKQSILFNNFRKAAEEKLNPKSKGVLSQENINDIETFCTEVKYSIKK